MVARETDDAAAAAWNDRMFDLRCGCQRIIECLESDGLLRPEWQRSIEEAADLMMAMCSIRVWEHLVVESGWSTSQYITRMQTSLRHTFAVDE
jgi:hypothetical protein